MNGNIPLQPKTPIFKKLSSNKLEETLEYKFLKKGSSCSFNSGISSEAESFQPDKPENQSELKIKQSTSKITKDLPEKPFEKKKYNDWKPEEDLLLLNLCSKFQQKWKKISSIIGTKTPRMCAYRIRKLKKFVKYKEETNKKKIFSLDDENKVLSRVKIPEKMIQHEIENNGFINFKKMRKKRIIKIKYKKSNKKSGGSNEIQTKTDFQSELSGFSRLKINENEVANTPEVTIELIGYSETTKRKNNSYLSVNDINMNFENSEKNFTEKTNNNLLYWALSRKNSPDIVFDPFNRGEFQIAYNQVFTEGYFRQKSNDTIVNKEIYVENNEKEKKTDANEKYDNFISFDSNNDEEIDELKTKIEKIMNNNSKYEEKKIMLDDLFDEIKAKTINSSNQVEIMKLMSYQSKILKGMISLSQNKSVD